VQKLETELAVTALFIVEKVFFSAAKQILSSVPLVPLW